MTIRINHNSEMGFPDDLRSPGPTIVSEATLHEVSRWFAPMSFEEAAARFRANIEIGGTAPFWEDRLFGSADETRHFTIGDVGFYGINPCQRCVVPARDPASGEVWNGFQKQFSDRRKASLPAWSNATRFPDYYRLSVNTRPDRSSTGTKIHIGDPVTLAPPSGS
jgi:uncharacterized protein YcbX